MSKSESKKKSSSTKDEEIPVEEVHTANDWEHADLGDEQRKQKFLRLMGAKKRKDDPSNATHADEQVPEKKHCRTKVENETINRELEKQFNESLQSKITHTRHGGLGFQTAGSSAAASSSDDWRDHSTKAAFVPASKPVQEISVEETTSTELDKYEEKDKKKKKKKERKSSDS